jgi:hypothetical protein
MESKGLCQVRERRESSWKIQVHGVEKQLHFTIQSLETIDFKSCYGLPLGIAYEYNCGDVARVPSFWYALSQKLVSGGQVVGSYVEDIEKADRVAFILQFSPVPSAVVYNNGEVSPNEKQDVIAVAKGLGRLPNPNNFLDVRACEHKGKLYSLRMATGELDVSLWDQIPLNSLGLKRVNNGDRICRLARL